MSDIEKLLEEKRKLVHIYREDIVLEEEDPAWRKNHPIGPIHVQLKCKICGEVLANDLKEFGWLDNSSYWHTNIQPHFTSKHI